ncbi:hypothetical protein FA13DRAFT_1735008 [Coprinellus micaceus]|uniref:Uncharacterized protein n=1 Tax=Coprinellus micaceus TaxID=71717 RepID=A0A4Y7T557_COPMI|nr:hypothetical protein FA13DRAFT_1735008 [Coprinellus micaceus]
MAAAAISSDLDSLFEDRQIVTFPGEETGSVYQEHKPVRRIWRVSSRGQVAGSAKYFFTNYAFDLGNEPQRGRKLRPTVVFPQSGAPSTLGEWVRTVTFEDDRTSLTHTKITSLLANPAVFHPGSL